MVFKGTKSVPKKRFALVYNILPRNTLKNMVLDPIKGVCNAIYQGMFALLLIILP
jgi:hypothetical protein